MRLIEVSRFLIRRFEPNFERGENRKIYSKLKWMYELFCENLLANKYANQYGFFFPFSSENEKWRGGRESKKEKKEKMKIRGRLTFLQFVRNSFQFSFSKRHTEKRLKFL